MDFSMCDEGTNFQTFKPCAIVWGLLHDFAERDMRIASERIRAAGGWIPVALRLPEYNNSTMHDAGRTEVAEVVAECLSPEDQQLDQG